MRYGMPYMGSKNQIAKWVIEHLPKKENLYDLFGGGGAITHCACESGKFENIIYNEKNELVFNGFKMAVGGGYSLENRWISREDFNKLKNKDPYVAICFSFGNDLRSYAYGKDKEKYKKALHYAICYSDFSLLDELGVNIDHNLTDRIKITNAIKSKIKELSCLESLERLQHLERLDLTNKDYADVYIKENSVIYCDPPYINTHKYIFKFDYDAFSTWCRKQKELVIISEYNMPEDRFICVAQKEKRSLMCKDDNTTKKTEKLFVPKHQYQMYLDAMAVLS